MSAGDDNISPRMIKESSIQLATPLTHINLSFQYATVPEKLKIAKVIAMFKKNEKVLVNSFHPISLLSTLNKLMEKLMYKRVVKFLNKHKILYKYQFGYRENHSTSMDLMKIVDNILHNLEKGKYTAGVYLDMSKAFDTVDHDLLLYKLNHH